MQENERFEQWAVVEVMGHRRFAGLVSEQAIGGASFIRVDVPAVTAGGEALPAFTKLLGSGSIYAISPCTEETARAFVARFGERSFAVYEAPRLAAPAASVDRLCQECGYVIEDCVCETFEDCDDD